MFNLVKISDSGASAPEIISINVSNSIECRANHVYTVKSGALTSPLSGDGFLFVPIETRSITSSADKLRGYMITPNMLFEAKIIGSVTNLRIGDNVSSNIDDGGVAIGVTADPGDFATIIDMSSQKINGKIIIRINA